MDRRHGFGIFTCSADMYRYEGEWYQVRICLFLSAVCLPCGSPS